MWNDNETYEDLIDFNYLKASINDIIKQDHLLPSTIGVFGDWGSGKSSLIKMIEEDHKDNDDELIIKFNGWLFEGYEDAKVALLETLIEEIIKARPWDKKAYKYISRLVKRVKWLKAITNVGKFGLGMYMQANTGIPLEVFGISSEPFDVNDYLKDKKDEKDELADKGIKEFHKDFAKLIEEAKLDRVIVIIDDLDRCTPPTVIATLEAIKLFLFVEKTVFIVAADERLINYAVKSRFPNLPSSDYDVAQDYLEKLIQIPIRIPALSQVEYETYINLLFAKKYLNKNNFDTLLVDVFNKNNDPYTSKLNFDNCNEYITNEDELKEDLLLTKVLNPLLVQILRGNPRQCKRFLNMLLMRINMSKAKGIDLKRIVLAKLMLLEYFKPESFQLLVKEIANSEDNILGILESKKGTLPDILENWKNDEWIKRWLAVEPKLGSEELKDYLYFIRTKTLEIKQSNRLSNEAKDILVDLLGKELISKNAITKSKSLSTAERTGILQELFEKYHRAEDTKIRSSLSGVLFNYVKNDTSLINEYFSFLTNLPATQVSVTMVPHVIGISKNGEYLPSKKAILAKWASSGIKALATAANSKLSKL